MGVRSPTRVNAFVGRHLLEDTSGQRDGNGLALDNTSHCILLCDTTQ